MRQYLLQLKSEIDKTSRNDYVVDTISLAYEAIKLYDSMKAELVDFNIPDDVASEILSLVFGGSGGDREQEQDSPSGQTTYESSEVSGSRNLIDDMDDIADDIIHINNKYSNGNQQNNSIKNILNSASYYDNPYDQVSSVTRSITQHAFENGNKRTAFDTLNMLLKDLNLSSPLTDSQKWNLIDDIANGVIKNVPDISRILQGQ